MAREADGRQGGDRCDVRPGGTKPGGLSGIPGKAEPVACIFLIHCRRRLMLVISDLQNTVLKTVRANGDYVLFDIYGYVASKHAGHFKGVLHEKANLYLLGNGCRTYGPTIKRFCSPDHLAPFGPGGLNAYAYCLGDPVNLMDPEGTTPVPLFNVLKKTFKSRAPKKIVVVPFKGPGTSRVQVEALAVAPRRPSFEAVALEVHNAPGNGEVIQATSLDGRLGARTRPRPSLIPGPFRMEGENAVRIGRLAERRNAIALP